MTAKTIEALTARIEAQQQKLAQLKEKKSKAESLARARLGKEERAADTRRKILAGAVILNAVELGKISPIFLEQLMDQALTKPADRELFNLQKKLPPMAQKEDQSS
jgi:large subunit ribosomal protein L7/L12